MSGERIRGLRSNLIICDDRQDLTGLGLPVNPDQILTALKKLPNHRPPGPEWLARPDADRHYPYLARVFAALRPSSIFEFGTFMGYGLATAAMTLPKLSHVAWVDNESYVKDSNRLAGENISAARRGTGWHPVPMTYGPRLDGMKLTSFDLVHVDGGHAYEECLADIEAGYKLTDRYLIGHDYDLEPGVRRAVLEFCDREDHFHLSLPDLTHGLWVIAIDGDWDYAAETLAWAEVGRVVIHPPTPEAGGAHP